MDGMHVFWNNAATTGSDDYTVSSHWECPPLNCMVETIIAGYYEFDDQSHAQIAMTSAEYLDSDGVTRHDDFGRPPDSNMNPRTVIYYGSLVRFDWALQVSNCWADYIMNVYEWGAYV
jgi:hypothetical protein